AAKLAAATLAVGTAGTVAGLERHPHHKVSHPAPAAAKQHRVGSSSLAARTEIPAPAPVAPLRAVSFERARAEARKHSGREHGGATTTSESSGRDGGGDESSSGSSSPHEDGSTSGVTEHES